jgi:hypothetical protein
MDEQKVYSIPEVIYEGVLEIQAGSPLSIADLPDLEDLDW